MHKNPVYDFYGNVNKMHRFSIVSRKNFTEDWYALSDGQQNKVSSGHKRKQSLNVKFWPFRSIQNSKYYFSMSVSLYYVLTTGID